MPKRKRVLSSDSDVSDLEGKRKKLRKKLEDLERKQRRRKQKISSDSSLSFESSSSETSEKDNPKSNINTTGEKNQEGHLQGGTIEQEQDPEILRLLGEEPSESNVTFGSEVHQTLADRWSKYLTLGVEKSEIEAMEKKYLIPRNIPYLKAPILNTELESPLTDQGKKEDKYSTIIQGHVGLALAALSKCIDAILKGDDCPIEDIKSQLLPSIVDAGKNMCGVFNMISTNRKYHVGANLNSIVKKIVKESKPDEFLCGKNFADKFREVKTQLKIGKEMKNTFSVPKKFSPTSVSSTFQRSSSLNYHRKYAKGRKKEGRVERPPKREREYRHSYKPYNNRRNNTK